MVFFFFRCRRQRCDEAPESVEFDDAWGGRERREDVARFLGVLPPDVLDAEGEDPGAAAEAVVVCDAEVEVLEIGRGERGGPGAGAGGTGGPTWPAIAGGFPR